MFPEGDASRRLCADDRLARSCTGRSWEGKLKIGPLRSSRRGPVAQAVPKGASMLSYAVRVWCHGAVFVEHFLKHLQRAKIRTGVVGHGGQNVLSCGRSGPGVENAEDGAETGKVCPGRVSRIFQDLPGFQCSKASLGRERSIPLLHVS